MTKNVKFGEPPTFKGDVEVWIRETERYLRTVHEIMWGLLGEGGSLDGVDNIASAENPIVTDGTPAGNEATINDLVAKLQVTGIIAGA